MNMGISGGKIWEWTNNKAVYDAFQWFSSKKNCPPRTLHWRYTKAATLCQMKLSST